MDRLSACCHSTVGSLARGFTACAAGPPGGVGGGGVEGGGQFAVILRTRGAFTLTTVYVEDRAKGTWVAAMHGALAVEACSVRLELKPTGLNRNLPVASVVVVRKAPAPTRETVAFGMTKPAEFRTIPRTVPDCPAGLEVSVTWTCEVMPGWRSIVVCVGMYRLALVAS